MPKSFGHCLGPCTDGLGQLFWEGFAWFWGVLTLARMVWGTFLEMKCPRVPVWVRGEGGAKTIWAMPKCLRHQIWSKKYTESLNMAWGVLCVFTVRFGEGLNYHVWMSSHNHKNATCLVIQTFISWAHLCSIICLLKSDNFLTLTNDQNILSYCLEVSDHHMLRRRLKQCERDHLPRLNQYSQLHSLIGFWSNLTLRCPCTWIFFKCLILDESEMQIITVRLLVTLQRC